MESVFEKYINLLEENEYSKLIKIVSSIFILIAPSFSFMFLYKREVFLSLDIFRLIIICLILNILLFYILYILISTSVYSSNRLKLTEAFIYQNKKTLEFEKKTSILLEKVDEAEKYGINKTEREKLKQECKNIENEIAKTCEEVEKIQEFIENYEEKKLTPFMMIEVTSTMVCITAIPWALHINDLFFKVNVNHEFKINRYLIYLMIPLGWYLLKSIYLVLKIRIKKKYTKLKSQ